MRTQLINDIASLRGLISLISNMWKGTAKQEYICVKSHYIDNNWTLQKRIIGLKYFIISILGEAYSVLFVLL